MEKDKILGVVLGILYYYVLSKIFSFLMLFEFIGGTISGFSKILFFICYIVLPIVILAMPVIIKFKYNKKFYKAILDSIVFVLLYISICITICSCISVYFETFSTYKWSNENWHRFRGDMVEDLEERYDLKGMTKDEIHELLGKEDGYSEEDNAISYYIGEAINYYIYFDENDVVIYARQLA